MVACHSGYTYAERPTALTWQGQRLLISQVLAEWRLPTGKAFRVCTADGQTFELFYDETHTVWEIHPY
jgi:hypothetical protein